MTPTLRPALSSLSLHRVAQVHAQMIGARLRLLADVPPLDGALEEVCSFEGRVQSMHDWCRRNENLVIRRNMRDAEVYAGFQRLSRVQPITRRYRRLAAAVGSLHLFGRDDAPVLVPKAEVVPIAEGNLAQEWFLLIAGRRYKALLVARDLDGFDSGVPAHARRFDGFATHNPELVRAMASELRRRLADQARTESAIA